MINRKLNICLIGHYNVRHNDEGVRNVAYYLRNELSLRENVLSIDICDTGIFTKVARFNPDIIHLIVGPNSVYSFILAKFLSILTRKITIISAVQPSIFPLIRFISILRPDLILVQSRKYANLFKTHGCNTKFFPNGIDVKRFVPSSGHGKASLRQKYGLDKNKFTILHVGPIKKKRNIALLGKLQEQDNQVIIVSRESQDNELDLYCTLKKKGCVIFDKYIEKIEEIYALSDCYVFLASSEASCIEIPLSVLEAMACNLPIISSKFRGLPDNFNEFRGLWYIENENELLEVLHIIKSGYLDINSRMVAQSFSWSILIEVLLRNYYELLSNATTEN